MAKQLFNNPNAHRGQTMVSIPMHKLYELLKVKVSNLPTNIDPDALCQNICVAIEEQQGTFPNLEPKPMPAPNPWQPEPNAARLALLGKLVEELGEATAATARAIIQGLDESHPVTGKPNRLWLEEELADLSNLIDLTIRLCNLNSSAMLSRTELKREHILNWLDTIPVVPSDVPLNHLSE